MMTLSNSEQNLRPPFDPELISIADYVTQTAIHSELAYSTARYCLMDALGCAMLALQYPACKKMLGPLLPGTIVPQGVRVPGTSFVLDPVQAAFNIGTMVRWLDFNDTWLAAEWGHPSDNLGAILAAADYKAQQQAEPLRMKAVLTAMIKAYEIQGILALENCFNRLGIDHVVLVKVASSALAAAILGGTKEEILASLSQAFVDGQSLRTYRHAPNTGSRKSWAAGDAGSRGLMFAWFTLLGEKGYPSALSAKTFGFNDAINRGKPLKLSRNYNSYVMENILFKVAFPAEFHAQTAVECAIKLHPFLKNRLQALERIELSTQEPAIRIISKTGPLHNPADKDHCLQYMVATALLKGDLKAEYYEDAFAKAHPEIDVLRAKMQIQEHLPFSKDYLNPEKRSIGNAIQLFFKDGSASEKISIEYPIGHKRRREEALPCLFEKFRTNLSKNFSLDEINQFCALFSDLEILEKMPVNQFMQMWQRA